MGTFKLRANTFITVLTREIKGSSILLYCAILSIYQLSLFIEHIQFAPFLGFFGRTLKMWLTMLLLLLLGIYLGSSIVITVQKRWAIIPVLAFMTGFLLMCAKMQRNKFDGLMIVILAICAYGKNYITILRVMFWWAAATVAIAMIGLPIGFTVEKPKVGLYGTGLALGFAHPNVWGSYVFFIFVLAWYLFMKDRGRNVRIGYFILSWISALFMLIVPKCRTQALLLLLFPLTILSCKRTINWSASTKAVVPKKVILGLLILFPFLCFFATIILGSQREWLAIHTMGTYIENFSKRFIQAGLAFREHGFPFFGELLRLRNNYVEQLGGYSFTLYVLDNGYVTFTIYRGMLWMVPALLWLSYANWKIIRNKDYSLLAISTLFCLMGLMERYTFQVYNFIFLYPLSVSVLHTNVATDGIEQIPGVGEEASS